jgi:hypothetical protein
VRLGVLPPVPPTAVARRGTRPVPWELLPPVGLNDWGWLFPLLVAAAAGLFILALADDRARSSAPGAEILFWAGLLLAYLPLALRSVAPRASRRERVALLCGLALALSLVKVLLQPDAPIFFDEFGHWRSLIDLQQNGRLFTPNPLMGISPSYPGLESATTALIGGTGLPVPAAAAIVVGAARFVLVLAIYLFFEQLSGSARIAAAGTVVYVSNPRFVFFDDQFAYESMALGLAALLLCLQLRRSRGDAPGLGPWCLLVAPVVALVITHHITSYATLGFLCLWVLAAAALRRWGVRAGMPVALTALVLAVEALWLATAARPTADYLQGSLAPTVQQVTALLQHHAPPRQLFQASDGQVQPAWQRALGLGSAALVVLALPVGLVRVWKEGRRQAPLLALALTSLAYPATLALHLTPDGAEVANRLSEFVFLGVGGVLAFTIDLAWPAGLRERAWAAALRTRTGAIAAAGWLSVVFSGSVIVGWAPQLSLPGPYLVGADNRSVDSISIAAAIWTREQLGPNNGIAADRTNRNLLGTYGDQNPVNEANGVATARVFLSPTFDPADLSILRQARVRYLLVDRRLSAALPLVSVYYDSGEEGLRPAGRPVPAARLDKFDSVPGASCIYDSGAIRIYDLGALVDARP